MCKDLGCTIATTSVEIKLSGCTNISQSPRMHTDISFQNRPGLHREIDLHCNKSELICNVKLTGFPSRADVTETRGQLHGLRFVDSAFRCPSVDKHVVVSGVFKRGRWAGVDTFRLNRSASFSPANVNLNCRFVDADTAARLFVT